jgi:undecaprenyl-diphosphatase
VTWVEAIVLGIVQGLTEFLPVSSSGHLRITSAIFFERDAGASFTAVTQLGTEAAVLIYFAKDIWRITRPGCSAGTTRCAPVSTTGWAGTPSGPSRSVFGFLFKDRSRPPPATSGLVATTLIVFASCSPSPSTGAADPHPGELPAADGVVMGFAQAMALIPGVSRSGGTLTAGLLLNLTREAARGTVPAAIPAVVMSGVFSIGDVFEPAAPGTSVPSVAQTVVATLIAFGIGYAAIAWLLRYVAHHTLYVFVLYRVALGTLVLSLLLTGTISAT